MVICKSSVTRLGLFQYHASNQFYYKSSWPSGDFWKVLLYKKNRCGYSLGNFAKNWATFYSIMWSHCFRNFASLCSTSPLLQYIYLAINIFMSYYFCSNQLFSSSVNLGLNALGSVTRFGENSPKWQDFKSLWQLFESLHNIWQNNEPSLEIFICYWAHFHCYIFCKYGIIKIANWSHWGTCPSSVLLFL